MPTLATHVRSTRRAARDTSATVVARPGLRPRDAASVRVIRIMHLLERIAHRFNEENVPVMVLKGAALHLTIHDRPEERPMSDLDLLVRPEDVGRVDAILEELDLHRGPSEFREDFFPRFHHEIQYLAGNTVPLAVDLHVRPLRLVRWSRLMPDDALWQRAEEMRIGDATVLVPAPEEMLIHLAAHSAIHDNELRRWRDDIRRWIDACGDRLDWTRFLELVEAWRLAGPVQSAFASVRQDGEQAEPEHVVERLARMRVTWQDRLALWHASRDRAHLFRSALIVLLTTPGWRFRLAYLRAVALPDPDYLDEWCVRHGRPRTVWTTLERAFAPILRRLPQVRNRGVRVDKSRIHGHGVFARRDFSSGQLIARYRGRRMAREGRYAAQHVDRDGHDALHEITGPLRFLNHSCRPNAELDEFRLVALRPIKADEELTINYGEDACDCAELAWEPSGGEKERGDEHRIAA